MPQHDMILANQAGAAFRADLNDALAALVANSSGATEPATMYAYMFWADTTSGLLKQRNAANNAWITIGTLASIGLGLLSRAGGSMTGLLNMAASTDIASAATVDLSAATGNVTRITGTTATSAFTMNAGQWHLCIADGAWPLTYHATTNKINTGGSNYTCAAGDRVLLHKDDDNIVQTTIIPANGQAIVGGKLAQSLTSTSINYVGLSTQIPLDDTIPQNTEGTEILTRAITPTNASSTIRVTAKMHITAPSGSGGTFIAALFKDTGANALSAGCVYCAAGGVTEHIIVTYEESAGSASARTYKLRGGPASAITMYYNGNASGRLLGGVNIVSLTVDEILP